MPAKRKLTPLGAARKRLRALQNELTTWMEGHAALSETLDGMRTASVKQVAELHQERVKTSRVETHLEWSREEVKTLTAERDQLAQDLDNTNTRLMDVEAALVNIAVRLA